MVQINKMKSYITPYIPVFIGSMIFSSIIYFVLMANQLVNPYDGLWEYSNYTAGYWELSLGRWSWLYLDQTRLGISTDPLTSLITLALFSIGILLLLDIFDITSGKPRYIICGLFLSNTAVCISLSYRYMSPTFGMAFLLNVFAAWLVVKIKNHFVAVLLSAFMIAVAMGLYQADIGCTCLVLLLHLLHLLYRKDATVREFLICVARCIVSAVLGGVLYIIFLNVHLKIFHTTLSAYNGASSYSLTNTVKNLPASIVYSYRTFFNYFFENYTITNIFQKYKIYVVVFLLFIVLLVMASIHIWKTNKLKAILFIAFIPMLPLACNAVSFIATSTGTSVQMTAPLALLIPAITCLCLKMEYKFSMPLRNITLAVLVLTLYGCIYQVQLDQNAMLEGKTATTSIAGDIIDRLGDEGYLDADKEFCVLGLPSHNKLFATSALYESANGYAKFGNWWSDPGCSRRSWQSTFRYVCGINIPLCSATAYQSFSADEEIREMPVFPAEGSIIEKDNIVIVKVSNGY